MIIVRKIKGLFICLAAVLLGACGINDDEVIRNLDNEIKFGTGDFDDGIEEVKSIFSKEEDFLMEVYLSDPFGDGTINSVLLQVEGDSETIYQEWEDSVDPNWEWMVTDFQKTDYDGKFDTGNYILRIYDTTSNLLAEGEFSIE